MSCRISFQGKRALVTGAGKGIGRNLAKTLVELGAETYALSRTLSDLESLKKECPSIHIVLCDVSDFANLESQVKSCLPIDLLVNNAGIYICDPFLDISVDSYHKHMDVNVKAPFLTSQIVAKDMADRKSGGSIVNVSSKNSVRAVATFAAYCMSKAALNQLTRSMALELAPHKIRVNSVLPTAIYTDLMRSTLKLPGFGQWMLSKIPIGRFGEIEEVNSVILFLLSDQAAMITGSEIPVDGGSLCAL